MDFEEKHSEEENADRAALIPIIDALSKARSKIYRRFQKVFPTDESGIAAFKERYKNNPEVLRLAQLDSDLAEKHFEDEGPGGIVTVLYDEAKRYFFCCKLAGLIGMKLKENLLDTFELYRLRAEFERQYQEERKDHAR